VYETVCKLIANHALMIHWKQSTLGNCSPLNDRHVWRKSSICNSASSLQPLNIKINLSCTYAWIL